MERKYQEKCGILKLFPITIEYIPVRLVLKKSLELTNMMSDMRTYLDILNADRDVLANVVHGSLWKEKLAHFKNKFVWPLVLYYDDYETNNPLGTHPCRPPQVASKFENIFTLTLFNTSDESAIGFQAILTKAIEELKLLEMEGINVGFEGNEKTMYFSLLTILGDNLGVNAILGFPSYFAANYCRFCLINRKDISNTWNDDLLQLRTTDNYQRNQVALNNLSQTVIKSLYIFNELPSFNMIGSLCVNVMHDKLEGVCQYDLGKVLLKFVSLEYFSWSTLNNRLNSFDYRANGKRNERVEIYLKQNDSSQQKVKLSAAEMLTFIRNLGLIIGELIPVNDQHWESVIKLKEILDILISKVCHRTTANVTS